MKLKSLTICLICLFCVSSLVDLAWSENYAILIGINKYPPFESTEGYDRVYLDELEYCAADMTGLKAALRHSKFTDDKNIKLLIKSEETTSENICRVLEKYQKELGEDDTILVAFAGHGISLAPNHSPDEKGDYFCCSNARIKYNRVSKEFENVGLISLTDMNTILEGFNCGSKIFFTDACRNIFEDESSDNIIEDESSKNFNTRSSGQRSGSSVRSGAVFSGNSIRGLINKTNMTNAPNNSSGFFRIASCSSGEVSHESEKLGHGVFTYYLIEGLKQKDNPVHNGRDGKIKLTNLIDYATDQTSNYVKDVLGGIQNPKYTAIEASGIIIGTCEIPKTPEPPPTPRPIPIPNPNPNSNPRNLTR